MRIVVDMMGGDNGLYATLPAVREFMNRHKDCELTLVGDSEAIGVIEGVEVIDAKKVMRMEAGALEVFRDKETSMAKAVMATLEKKADAIVSSGSTGAFLSLCALRLKKLPGVLRPALVCDFPTLVKGKKVTILDIGASSENTPEELNQFALMGSLYSKYSNGIEEPQVYLLSNGVEEEKGTPLVKAAHVLLKDNKKIDFRGNIEARDTMAGFADVIVCDGYSGNVLLKSSEGVAKTMSRLIKKAFKKNFLTMIGYLFAKSGFDEMTKTMDYKNTGGALLLGVNAAAVKAHGNSDARSFCSALEVAYRIASADLLSKIKEGFA